MIEDIYGNVKIWNIYDSARLIISDHIKWENLKLSTIKDDAFIIDRYNKCIYLSNGWTYKCFLN